MLVFGIVNALTRMWSAVYLEYFILDTTVEKSKGESEIKFFEMLEMTIS